MSEHETTNAHLPHILTDDQIELIKKNITNIQLKLKSTKIKYEKLSKRVLPLEFHQHPELNSLESEMWKLVQEFHGELSKLELMCNPFTMLELKRFPHC